MAMRNAGQAGVRCASPAPPPDVRGAHIVYCKAVMLIGARATSRHVRSRESVMSGSRIAGTRDGVTLALAAAVAVARAVTGDGPKHGILGTQNQQFG